MARYAAQRMIDRRIERAAKRAKSREASDRKRREYNRKVSALLKEARRKRRGQE